MEYEELLEYLDLDNGGQFEYFEAMADLAECDQPIYSEALYQLFLEADNTMIEELLNDYFEDVLDGLPEDSSEIYDLLHQIKMCLVGLIANAEEESDYRQFASEFTKFHDWYCFDSEVELTLAEKGRVGDTDNGLNVGDVIPQCLRDAITTARIEKLGGDKYSYAFDGALDYELDSYTMSFADLMSTGSEDENDGTIVFSPEDEEWN